MYDLTGVQHGYSADKEFDSGLAYISSRCNNITKAYSTLDKDDKTEQHAKPNTINNATYIEYTKMGAQN